MDSDDTNVKAQNQGNQTAKLAEPCHLDRLPYAVLQDILHRAACRRIFTQYYGNRVLEEKDSSVQPWMHWAQVTELCRLQTVSRQFYQVASTVQNLHLRISPVTFKRDLEWFARFLKRARCAKSLLIAIRCKDLDNSQMPAAEYESHIQSLASQRSDLLDDMSETFEDFFLQTPCLEQFAVVWDVSTVPSGNLTLEKAASLPGVESSTHMLKALAAHCPQLTSLLLGDQQCRDDPPGQSLQVPSLAAASRLASVCGPFVQLKKLIIQEVAQDAEAISTFVRMCPALQELIVEQMSYLADVGEGPKRLLLASETLEVLHVWLFREGTLLDIRTPKLYKMVLNTHYPAPMVVIDAPKLSDLEIEGSAQVTALAQWKLERLNVQRDRDSTCCVWDCNGSLHEAVQACLGLTCLIFDTEAAVIGSASTLIKGLEELEELSVPSKTLLETCQLVAKKVKLPELKKLTVLFDTDQWSCPVVERQFQTVLQSVTVESFPRLEFLSLSCSGYYTAGSVRALISLRERCPALEVFF